jgi:hypothetical protein
MRYASSLSVNLFRLSTNLGSAFAEAAAYREPLAATLTLQIFSILTVKRTNNYFFENKFAEKKNPTIFAN